MIVYKEGTFVTLPTLLVLL